jgi:Cu/Ag efflux pump CusA
MRAGWGLVGLVVALAIVAVLARKQLSTTVTPQLAVPAIPGAPASSPGTAVEQSRSVQEQVKQQVETQMQARPISEADK